jgi:hypothetical protein
MNKKLLFAVATAISVGLSGVASAATITGQLSINGSDTFTSTSVTFANPANIGGASGSFALELSNCTGCVTMISSLSTGTVLPATIYAATEGAISTDMVLNVASFSYVAGPVFNTLTISGTGYADLTNFDQTPIAWLLTTQGAAGASTYTFSATEVAAVPLPGALPLFASGIVGLWALGRKRKKQKLESAIA